MTDTKVTPNDQPNPAAIWQLIQGFSAYWLVVAALELGLFPALDGGPRAATELSDVLGTSARHLAIVLDGLAALGLLTEASGRYALAPDAWLLVPGQPGYMGDLVVRSPGPLDNWRTLAATVRSGRPVDPIDDQGAFYADLVRATFPTQYAVARRVAERIADGNAPSAVLDVGAGAAPWAVALLERFPAATAVVNDLPDVLVVANEVLTEHGLADRARFVAGDYRIVELEQESFDVAALGHVCRAEGEEGAAALIARVSRTLRAGGTLVLADYFVDDDGRDAINARLLGVTMMANTLRGATFTYSQYREWLSAAGLAGIEFIAPLPGQEVLLARKEPGVCR